ncbi:acetyl-CoA carboxylase carboxyltransferase subunit alpha [candidate division WOR-3 bacterium]|nr:acetyl-CoA carboxylase carboxyltransferase subunit alpha [candidate division WOR-3 bacterium]
MIKHLDFEKPIIELHERIEELKALNGNMSGIYQTELKKLNAKLVKIRKEIFSSLTPWQRVEMARHPNRPYTSDYVKFLFKDWTEIHGDRRFSDDNAIITGIGSLEGISFVVVGHEKGRKITEKVKRNFGSAHPEGYRKALRVMKLGGKFNLPIVCLVDTAGAYPGIGAEERGQALAIAENIKEIAVIPVPIIVIITGEGGSGGALAIGIGDRIYMQEFSVYSVISPEGCASIIFRNQEYKKEAAGYLKITAEELKKFQIIDGIISEPEGGAHSNHEEAAKLVGETILKLYQELKDIPRDDLIDKRIEKFSQMGVYIEG